MKPDEYANGKGIADSQIRCCRSLCRQALEKAAEEHLILCNPAIGCKCPPAKREEMKIPSWETMQRVLIQAKEENYYELFLLEFATGLRLRELAALQWDDLNLTTGELRIDNDFEVLKIVKEYSPLMESKKWISLDDQTKALQQVESAVDKLMELWKDDAIPTCLDVLRSIQDTGLFKLDERVGLLQYHTTRILLIFQNLSQGFPAPCLLASRRRNPHFF